MCIIHTDFTDFNFTCEKFGSYNEFFHECFLCDIADECEYYKQEILPNLTENEIINPLLELVEDCESDYYLNNNELLEKEIINFDNM